MRVQTPLLVARNRRANSSRYGREIFDQQQLHAKAADTIKGIDIDGLRGWIVSPVGGKPRIRRLGV